jgi:quercetin dioxygenase-like cupin family protein
MSHAQVADAAPVANAVVTGLKLNQGKYVQSGAGEAYWGPGDEVTFLLTGEETKGALTLLDFSVPPGGGPPPHIHHREDESFYIREGTFAIRVGDVTVTALPGDFVHVPRGTVHCFKNTSSAQAKMLVSFTPSGMEKFFAEAFFPAGDRSVGPPIMSGELLGRMLTSAPKNGMEFLPPESQ